MSVCPARREKKSEAIPGSGPPFLLFWMKVEGGLLAGTGQVRLHATGLRER